MSIQNVGLGIGSLGLPGNPLRTGAGDERRGVVQGTPQQATKLPELRAPEAGAVPAEAPAGTDPALWQVLSHEERVHFARFQALGPLTYGRSTPAPAQSAIPRGGRLDVRV